MIASTTTNTMPGKKGGCLYWMQLSNRAYRHTHRHTHTLPRTPGPTHRPEIRLHITQPGGAKSEILPATPSPPWVSSGGIATQWTRNPFGALRLPVKCFQSLRPVCRTANPNRPDVGGKANCLMSPGRPLHQSSRQTTGLTNPKCKSRGVTIVRCKMSGQALGPRKSQKAVTKKKGSFSDCTAQCRVTMRAHTHMGGPLHRHACPPARPPACTHAGIQAQA